MSPPLDTRAAVAAARARPAVARSACAAALCALLALAAMGALGWPWDWLSRDVRAALLARNEYAARAALEGRLPLWNPFEHGGMPLLATTTGAMLYPPVVAAYAIFSVRSGLEAVSLLHLFLIFFGTALYLGRHGLSLPAALFAAAVALAPLLGALGAYYPNCFAAAAWVPLLLFFADCTAAGSDARWIGALALAWAMQWLAGYPDYPLDTAVVLAVTTTLGGSGSLPRRWLALAAGLALGGALATAQLLPLAEMIRESSRASALAVAGVVPNALRVPSVQGAARPLATHYGAAFLALAGIGVSLRSGVRRGWLVAFVWCTFAVYLPFSLLYLLPPWSGSRAPIGWFGIAPLLIGFLAAAGLQRLLAARSAWLRGLALLLTGAALAHGVSFAIALRRVVVEHPESAGDLAQRAQRLTELLAGPGHGAGVLAWPERRNGSFLRHGLRSPTAYEPSYLEPRRVAQLLDAVGLHFGTPTSQTWAGVAAKPDLAALLGVGLVVGPPGWVRRLGEVGFVEVGTLANGDRVVYRQPVPRARLVHRVVVVQDDAASLARVVEHAGEAATTAVVTVDQAVSELREPAHDAAESATISVDEPERVEIAARVASPALLVLRDTDYPGWHATVDGVPAVILRVDHAFRAVALPAGEHRVVFVYAPASVRIGLAVSGAALLVVVALLLFGGRARP